MRPSSRLETGRGGEDLAARFLTRRGYAVLARNFRSSVGEIDLVAEKDGEVVFVEVRSRPGAGTDVALESVVRRKQRRLIATARLFLAASGRGEVPVRFDIIAIGASCDDIWHEVNAFQDDG